jgi:hypothetical protein
MIENAPQLLNAEGKMPEMFLQILAKAEGK